MESKENKESKTGNDSKSTTGKTKVSHAHPLKSAIRKVEDKVKNMDADGMVAKGVKKVGDTVKSMDTDGSIAKGIKKAEKKIKKADGNTKKIIGAVAAGVAIGTAVGMHITPDKVETTKNKIKKKVQGLASDLAQKMDNLSTAIGKTI